MMKLRIPLVILFLFGFIPAIAYGQCEACQMQTQVVMTHHTAMQTWTQQSMQSSTMRYSSMRTETISAQCIGAAIDAFIAAGGFANWAASLPAAFEAYQACDGGGAMTARSRRMVRREIFRQVLRRRPNSTSTRVRVLERVRLRIFGKLKTSEGGLIRRFFNRVRSRRSGGGDHDMGGDHFSMSMG